MEREKGFEPSTSTLARWHSTTELLPRNCGVTYGILRARARESYCGRDSLPDKRKTPEGIRLPGFVSRRRLRDGDSLDYSSSLVMMGARLPVTSPLLSMPPLRVKVATFLLQSRSPVAVAAKVAFEPVSLLV